jgi:uncharacterized membrane protein YidH (DUF202 family)
MLVGAVGVFIGFTFRNPVMFGVGFFLVCVGYTLHMRAYIRYIYSDKIRAKNYEPDPWVQAMTKSEFLKQYKGMLVGAVGVFIVFTFRNPVMFGVGFFLVCVGYILHMRAYIRYIYSDKIRAKNYEPDPIKRMLRNRK